ncbi:GNAT family N-acetyltransferase [Agrococcus sp. Marseille-Q4369]|uniref:GNAT family N-acetyltransferase n=1 Tax=Agrococcus sp. Marseille-Q4369 TaxID=2810513 RepID=UPI001B8D387A|nr:GNAT family N-acetyltransferase [Agrococcus sp. Marseille-Q4369]QUW19405.1 N-acetyltransferase [Agrococcus sp. Marseille-Q4369]
METSVTRRADPDRFEITADGPVAGFAQFFDHGEHRVFFHTAIREEHAGHGLATAVIGAALAATRDEGKRIVAICPLVKRYVEEHADEWSASVDLPTPEMLQRVPRRR